MAKPAVDIKEGVFYDKIEGYVIKIGKKEKDGSTIRNIVVYEKDYGLQDKVIVADSGKMKISEDKRYLEFYLNSGWRYSEKGDRNSTNTELTRLGFKEYKKVFDLSSFKMNRTEDSIFKDNWRMLSIRQLNKAVDSLEKTTRSFATKVPREVAPYLIFARLLDSNWAFLKKEKLKPVKSFKDIVPDSMKATSIERAISQINSVKVTLDQNAADYAARRKDLASHLIEWHRKFTMSIACLVLFLIGAPLGSIIRKGGIGTPLVFAVAFFVIFFLLNNFGEKFARQDVLTPLSGMWLATFILVPVGIFLTLKAMRDSQLFNQEFYFRFSRRLKRFVNNIKLKKKKEAVA